MGPTQATHTMITVFYFKQQKGQPTLLNTFQFTLNPHVSPHHYLLHD